MCNNPPPATTTKTKGRYWVTAFAQEADIDDTKKNRRKAGFSIEV